MKTLLWKDYRHNRQLFAVVGAFLLAPYVLFPLIAAGPGGLSFFAAVIRPACLTSLVVSVFVSAFVAGNAFAGERVDRSAEFVAYLPIRRKAAVASKAIVAIGACVLAWGANAAVVLACPLVGPVSSLNPSAWYLHLLPNTAVAMVFVFGVSWLFSSFRTSSASAAASGLGTAVLVVVATVYLSEDLWRPPDRIPDCWIFGYMFGVILVGVGCFVAGSIVALRRVEP